MIVADLFVPDAIVHDAIAEGDVPAKQFPLVTYGAEGPEPGSGDVPPHAAAPSHGCLLSLLFATLALLGMFTR